VSGFFFIKGSELHDCLNYQRLLENDLLFGVGDACDLSLTFLTNVFQLCNHAPQNVNLMLKHVHSFPQLSKFWYLSCSTNNYNTGRADYLLDDAEVTVGIAVKQA